MGREFMSLIQAPLSISIIIRLSKKLNFDIKAERIKIHKP